MSDDPLHDEQLEALERMLRRSLSDEEYEGFLIVGNRFVDRFGHSRIRWLSQIFGTEAPAGRAALAASLVKVARSLGSFERFAQCYPVTIIPAAPAFPVMPIIGIETICDVVYRVLDSRSPAIDHIRKTGKLPFREAPVEPVLRATPKAHWCAYQKWETPEQTRRALQVLPQWSDCQARATLATASLKDLCFVPYSLDPNDDWTRDSGFHGYFFEPITEDHDEMNFPGMAVQIGVCGEPEVARLELWDGAVNAWQETPRKT